MKSADKYFSRYFFYKLARHKVLLIVSLVANILALPLMSIVMSSSVEGICNLFRTSTQDGNYSYELESQITRLTDASTGAYMICFLVFGILFVISLLTPSLMMSYNHRKSDSDMYLSLPLSTGSRFFADALAGAVISVFPLFINFLGGFIFIQKGAAIISANPQIFGEYISNDLTRLTVNNAYDTFVVTAVVGIMTVAGSYFCSLFFACCTGRRAQSIIYSIITPAILTGIGMAVSGLVMKTAGGIKTWKMVETIPAYFGHFGILETGFKTIYTANFSPMEKISQELYIPLSVIIAGIITNVLLFFGAYLCTVKRKAENTEKPFAIEGLYKVTSSLLVAFMIAVIIYCTVYQNVVLVTAAIISVIVAFVIFSTIQLVHHKSFKKLPRILLHFVGAAVASSAVFLAITFSRGLGTAEYVPSPDEIETVTIDTYAADFITYDYITYTEKSDIEIITSLHQKCVDNKAGTGYSFYIKYKLKNGDVVERIYEPGELTAEVRSTILSTGTTIYRLLPYQNQITEAEGTFALADDSIISKELTTSGVKKLIEAIRADCNAGALTKGKTIGVADISWHCANDDSRGDRATIYVTENSENIIKVLKDESNYQFAWDSDLYPSDAKISYENKIVMIVGPEMYNYCDKNDVDKLLYVRNKDMQNEKVKELITLIYFCENPPNSSELPYNVTLEKYGYFGIKTENTEKAQQLIDEIKAEREKNNDKVDFTDFYLYDYSS